MSRTETTAHAIPQPGRPRLEPQPADQARFLSQVELANRWKISPRTLENWRWRREGPAYLKIGGRVLYRLEDIEAFEADQRHAGGPPAAGRGRRRGKGA